MEGGLYNKLCKLERKVKLFSQRRSWCCAHRKRDGDSHPEDEKQGELEADFVPWPNAAQNIVGFQKRLFEAYRDVV